MIIKFPPREDGQGLVEYALILVLVAIVVIAVLLQLGPQIGKVFSQINYVLGNPANIGSQVVTIEDFRVTGEDLIGCGVTLDTLRVRVTENGQPVSGVSVGATVNLQQGGPGLSDSRTTDGNGVAQWTNIGLGTDPNACAGRTATATISGGPSATASY